MWAGAQYGVREQMFPYPKETTGVLSFSAAYSIGPWALLHQRWIGLCCTPSKKKKTDEKKGTYFGLHKECIWSWQDQSQSRWGRLYPLVPELLPHTGMDASIPESSSPFCSSGMKTMPAKTYMLVSKPMAEDVGMAIQYGHLTGLMDRIGKV